MANEHIVLVCSGCYHELPKTGWLTQQTLFLTVLEAGRSRIKVSADLVSSENLLPESQTAIFLLYPHMVKGAKGLPGVSFIRILITSQRPHHLIPSYWGLEFWGYINIQSIAHMKRCSTPIFTRDIEIKTTMR